MLDVGGEDVIVEDEPEPAVEPATPKARKAAAKREDDDDEEDDFDADDVEEDLDEILKARLAAAEENADDEEDEGGVALDVEDRNNNVDGRSPSAPRSSCASHASW